MCQSVKIISRIKEGQLSRCKVCNIYHLTYNNVLFEFTVHEFESFKKYLQEIDIEYWEQENTYFKMSRKIPIPTIQQNLFLMFSRREIQELKALIFDAANDHLRLLNINEIDNTLCLN